MYLIYQQETATNTTKSTDVNPGVNRAWLGSIWPSAGFVPKSAGFSAELILLAMLEVPFLPDCVASSQPSVSSWHFRVCASCHQFHELTSSLVFYSYSAKNKNRKISKHGLCFYFIKTKQV